MRLLRGWQGLGVFWAGVAALCGAGTVTLQIIGSSPQLSQQIAARLDNRDSISGLAALVPAVATLPIVTSADVVEAAPAAPITAQAPTVVTEQSETEVTSISAAAPALLPAATSTSEGAAVSDTAPAAPPSKLEPLVTKRQLRLARDSRPCPTPVCSKWTVIARHAKHPATIDMAGLHLAPSLRQAAERGEIELIVDAVERHETLNGRDIVIFVATGLTGVAPHDKADRPELLPLPVPGS